MPSDTRARRARTLRVTGVVGLLAAVLFWFAAGPLPALALLVLGAGNLLCAAPVARTGAAPNWARALIVVGGVGFVAAIAVTMVQLASTGA